MIAPLALIGLLTIPVIVAFYMLRLRRRDRPVSSIFLWAQLVRDVEANAPWQRLRASWLLALQLLIALLVVVAAARPFAEQEARVAPNLVLVIDTSASMGATDDGRPRIQLARKAAERVLSQLPAGGRVTVVSAADSAQVVAAETDDLAAARDAIAGIPATQLPGDLTDAFALGSALAARQPDSEVVLVTDANAESIPGVAVGAPVRVELVGSSDDNQAVAALSARRRSGGAQLDVFVAVSNGSDTDVTRRLELYGDEALVEARDVPIPARSRTEALLSTVPPGTELLEARLAGEDGLAIDDRAFALIPRDEPIRTLLVGERNAYLENALALLPRLELYAVGAAGYADAVADADAAGTPYGLFVYDRYVPDEPPPAPAIYVAPPEDGMFGELGDVIDGPTIGRVDPDHPLLRFIDLSTVHVGRARTVDLAADLRTIVATGAGEPLLAAGTAEGHRVALLTFALGDSDLPLQVAFPLLMSNLIDFAAPASGSVVPPSAALGEPVPIVLDPRTPSVTVVDDGVETELELVAGRATLAGAQRVGVRELRTADGELVARVAANLFDEYESDIAPGDPARFSELGRVAGRGERPRPQARNEWWWPLAALALLVLSVEWLVFHRPSRAALTRWLRGGAARLDALARDQRLRGSRR
ncbi:MAG: VWA domain-containing protein [Candidatus Limnocylindria bacterium]